jgi:glycosyltransferase 2 family protein
MRWLKAARIGSFVLITALFAIILAYTDREKVWKAFFGIRWSWAVWLPVLNVANTFVEALRLSVILFPIKKRLPVRNSFNSTLVGIIGNVTLPLRFGDGARAYYIAKTEKINLSSALSALMLDRIADFLIFFSMMALTAILYPFPPSVIKMGLTAAGFFAVAVFAVFALAGIGHHVGRKAGRIRRRIAQEVNHFMTGLSVMRNAGLLFPILVCSAVSWLLRAAMVWFMFQAFDLDLPLMATPLTLIVLNFGIAVVSTPANLGGFELAVVGALKLFSVETEIAFSYAVALHAMEVAPMVAFGMFFLWFEGFKTRDVLDSVKKMQSEQANAVVPGDGNE